MYLKHLLLVGILALTLKVEARAVIDITQGNIDPIPIAIENFTSDSEVGKSIASVIANDLESTGFFKIINKNAFMDVLSVNKTPHYPSWRKLNATAIITGAVYSEDGKIVVDFKMWDPFTEQQTEGGNRYKVNPAGWRRVAHKIADKIYKRITGENGYFDTRIIFIAESGTATRKIKRLAVMDQDGANLRLLTNGRDLVITPRFDMKSQQVIYMSYKNVIPKVFLYNLETGSQKLVGNFPGMSFAPRFSPDGTKAIMSIAKDGSTNIYEIDLQTSNLHQITNDRSVINTSPSYSPDGAQITFNSDRGGSQQIYIMSRDGYDIKRISFGGGTYATPVWSPRGDFIAFTKMKDGQFFIGVMRPDGSGERLLTTSWLDEGPTWSPNGRVIMFGRGSKNGSNRLYAVDVTGYHERQIPTPGDASDPAWSPPLD